MFEEIYEKRNLKSETMRRMPVDEHEVYHASKIGIALILGLIIDY